VKYLRTSLSGEYLERPPDDVNDAPRLLGKIDYRLARRIPATRQRDVLSSA